MIRFCMVLEDVIAYNESRTSGIHDLSAILLLL